MCYGSVLCVEQKPMKSISYWVYSIFCRLNKLNIGLPRLWVTIIPCFRFLVFNDDLLFKNVICINIPTVACSKKL